MEQSVTLLLSGAPLPADMQRADACTKVPLLLLCMLLALLLLIHGLLQLCCRPRCANRRGCSDVGRTWGGGGGSLQSHSAHAVAFAA